MCVHRYVFTVEVTGGVEQAGAEAGAGGLVTLGPQHGHEAAAAGVRCQTVLAGRVTWVRGYMGGIV